MAAAKKKVPAKKQKAAAAKKATVEVKAKTKAGKAPAKKKVSAATKKAKAEGKVKSKVKVAAKTKPKSKSKPNPKVEVKVKVKTKAGNAPAKKAVLQKKVSAKKPALTKKNDAAVAPATDRFRGLKSMLLAKRDALLKEAKQEIVKYVSGENRQLVDTAVDEADWAAVEISEDINLKRLSAQRQLLKDVEECLRKVNEGTYGICEDCGEEISEKRLRVIPTASLCIDCKEQREKMAILDQDTEI